MLKKLCLLSAVALAACGATNDDGTVSEASALTGSTIEIDCGSNVAVGSFIADKDFGKGGAVLNHANTIDLSGVTNPAPAAVYQTARTGSLDYTIPGFGAGTTNTVRLHFAETYFTAAGKRVFNVTLNGTPWLTNFDIWKASVGKAKGATGTNKAHVEQITAAASASGSYVITFKSVTNVALVSGIEIDVGAACTAGAACTPTNACLAGTISCSTGSPVCVAGGANTAANGSTCGTNEVCDNGVCGACTTGAACMPANVCATGAISCATGTPVCVAGGANTAKNGATCGTNEVCSNGTCGACTPGAACTPTNACDKGVISCSTGAPVCTDQNTPVADGTACGGANVCQAGQCLCHATTAHVPAPAAYYPFDVDATDVDHGFNGTPLNVITTPGLLGNAYFFNGALDTANNSGVGPESFVYLGFGASQVLAGARTVCAWIGEYPGPLAPGQTIFATEDSPSSYNHLGVQSTQPPAGSACGAANEVFMVDGVNGCQRSGLTINPADWNYVCYAYDGASHATFFVNGASSTLTVPKSTVPVWNGNIYMGNAQEIDSNVLQGAFNGYIDEVTVWSSYVSPSAMSFMFNGGLGCKAP